MKVTLTYLQRLALDSVLDESRVFGPKDIRRVWAIQDRLQLSEDEKRSIGYEIRVINGVERKFWDAEVSNPPADQEFDFHERDVLRIKAALNGFPQAGGDRKWLRPLLDMFLPEEEEETK